MKNRKETRFTLITALALLIFTLGYGEKKGGHDHSKHEMKSSSHEEHQKVPQLKKKKLDEYYEHYLGIHKALIGDDFGAAKKAAEKIDALKFSGKDVFTQKLKKLAGGISAAKDIKEARLKFIHLSVLTISVLERNKYDGDSKAMVFHCPMAADGKGADWVQSDAETKNPYYGKSMLACGSKTKTIRE